MMMKRKAMCLAVAASLGVLGATQANAVLTIGTELPAVNVLTPAVATYTAAITNFAPSVANPLYISFALSGSATYSTNPSMACTSITGALATGLVTLAAGGAGTNIATFLVTGAANTTAFMSSCTITLGTVGVSAWPQAVNLTFSASYGNNIAPSTVGNTALFAASSLFTNVVTAGSNLTPVASGFISFSAGGATTLTTALLGNFTIAGNGNLREDGVALGSSSAISAYVTAVTVSLAGAPLGGANNIFITQTAGAAFAPATCASTKLASAVAGTSITFTALAGANLNSAYISYAACMGVTGAVIPNGTITVGVTGVANTDLLATPATGTYQISTLIASTTTLGTITRNGASTEVLNLPPSTNADAGFLRIYNNSSLSGAVVATVYSEAGVALATSCSLGTVAAQNVLVLSMPTLESTCAITPPASGRYRVLLTAPWTSMRAQALARTGGVLVNISPDTHSTGN